MPHVLAAALTVSSLLAASSASATTYYWDGNNDTAGFGTAGGTWADPTTGTLTSGWTTAINGDADIVGNSITTTTSDTLNFGRASTGFSLLTGTITVSGTVNSGNMSFGSNDATVTTLTGGTINFGNAVAISMSNAFGIIESQITGASTSISKSGTTSTLRFANANNSYTGFTSIIGTLQVTSLADGNANSSIGASSNAASNLVLIGGNGGGTLSYIGSSNASTNRLFSLNNSHSNGGTIASNGDGTLNFTNTGAVAYGGTANQARTLGLSGTNTGLNILSASIGDNGSGAVAVTKSGTGNWVLASNSNSYTGVTTISGGTLSVSKMADYGVNSTIGQGTAGVGISLNGGSLVYTGTGDDTNRLIQFSANGTILNNGSGALNFTETGNFNVQVTNNNGRTFTLGGTNGGTISGAIQNNNAGVVSFVKTGSGTWVLGGANTYTGATTVSDGTLLISGSTASGSAVTVGGTGTLGGTGTIGGATTLNGTLSPGNSPGTLTFGGNLTVNNGATYLFEGGDLAAVGGALDLNDNWTLSLGSGLVDGGSVTIFTYDTLASSPDLIPTFDITNLGFTPSGTLSLTDAGGSIVLNGVSVIPEPASLALLGLGGLMMLRRRK